MMYNKLTTFILLATVVLFTGCESNQPPNVQVGPAQTVNVGDRVTLRGSASDPDGAVETYRWEQITGPSVLLSNANQASASFVAPKVKGSQILAFRLTVVDDNNATATDQVPEMVVIPAGKFSDGLCVG